MDPNDPNTTSASPSSSPAADAGGSQDVTLDALYGPSAPASDTQGAADQSATLPPMDPSGALPPMDQPGDVSAGAPQDTQSFGAATIQDPLAPADQATSGASQPPADLPQDQSFGATSSPTDYQTPQPSDQDQQFYNDVAPETPPAVEGIPEPPPSDYGAGSYDPNQPQEQAPMPEGDSGGLPPDQSSPASESGAPGGLPPIPSRSKLPFIILGAVVVVMLLAVVVLFALTKAKKPQATPASSVQPSATVIPVTCAEDPQNPDCVQESPTDSTSTGSSIQSPGTSSTGTTPSLSPQQCQLLYGGPCPQ